MAEFQAGDETVMGYLAVPKRGHGPGVLVLHAWWGLTATFKHVCDRLAAEGFVAFAPDLYDGRTAATINEAKDLMNSSDFERMRTTALAALARLHTAPIIGQRGLGMVGFSMGANWAFLLNDLRPDDIAAVVTFYGTGEMNFSTSHAAYLGHYAEHDEFDSLETVRELEAQIRSAGREVTFHVYPETEHWFFEEDRPEAYDATAAHLAWARTTAFLHSQLD
ncbi:MAG: dienelactone hydrolase family protein [Herpetosiphonaceae bacterium]|nr:dienelactone hydrolase family protein [Herpetosiphonaceae bacterium]